MKLIQYIGADSNLVTIPYMDRNLQYIDFSMREYIFKRRYLLEGKIFDEK